MLSVKALSKTLIIGGTAGVSLYALHINDYSLDNIGLFRFGRAGLVVCDIKSLFKWAFNEIYF